MHLSFASLSERPLLLFSCNVNNSWSLIVVTFRVNRRPREMHCGHTRVCLSVCLSAAACLHYCTHPAHICIVNFLYRSEKCPYAFVLIPSSTITRLSSVLNMVIFNADTGKHNRKLEMWANAQGVGRPAKHRWRPLLNAAKFGWRSLRDAVQ